MRPCIYRSYAQDLEPSNNSIGVACIASRDALLFQHHTWLASFAREALALLGLPWVHLCMYDKGLAIEKPIMSALHLPVVTYGMKALNESTGFSWAVLGDC